MLWVCALENTQKQQRDNTKKTQTRTVDEQAMERARRRERVDGVDDAPAADQEPGAHAVQAALEPPEAAEPAAHCVHCVAPTTASISHT